jgi:hypothetical protein
LEDDAEAAETHVLTALNADGNEKEAGERENGKAITYRFHSPSLLAGRYPKKHSNP